MSTPFEKLLTDVAAVGAWLAQQQPDLESDMFQKVKKSQSEQVMRTVQGFVGLTPTQATQVGEVLKKGPWQPEDRAAFAACISQTLCGQADATSQRRRKNQDVVSFRHFFSEKDLPVLADETASIHTKADQVASRLVKVQLWLASESGYKAVMMAAMAAGVQLHTAPAKIAFLDEVKGLVKAKTKNFPKTLALPTPFPERPQDLPQSVLQQAYTHDDQPKSLDETACLIQSTIVRKSSTQYRNSEGAIVPAKKRPAPSCFPSSSQDPNAMMQAFMGALGNFVATHGAASSSNEPADLLKNLKLLRPKAKASNPADKREDQDQDQPEPSLNIVTDKKPSLFVEPPELAVEEAVSALPPLAAAKVVEDAVKNRKELKDDAEDDMQDESEEEGEADPTPAMKKPAAKPPIKKNVLKKPSCAKPKSNGKGKGKGKEEGMHEGPGGWTVDVRYRKTGKSIGQKDIYYHAPDGKRFRIYDEAKAYGYTG